MNSECYMIRFGILKTEKTSELSYNIELASEFVIPVFIILNFKINLGLIFKIWRLS